jgi:serine protease AprX
MTSAARASALWGANSPVKTGKTEVGVDINKIAVDIDTTKTEPMDVIVQFTAPPTEHHFNKVLRRGGKLKAQFRSVRGAAFTVSPAMLKELSRDPEVAFISPDRKVKSRTTPTYDYYETTINAPYAWGLGLNGSGIGVAVLDSGIAASSDLTGRVVYNQSFVPGETSTTTDLYGHGTHVAGIIGGSGAQSTGSGYSLTIKGVAPSVKLVNLRVLDENGASVDSTIIAALDEAIALQSTYNIRVINLSVGRPVYETYSLDPLCQAAEAAWKAGIAVVVAAGNDGRDQTFSEYGYGTLDAPGNDPYVITVGAMNTNGTAGLSDDQIASYSSKGPTPVDQFVKPDVVAPGNQIISLRVPGSTLDVEESSNQVPMSLYQTNGSSATSSAYFVLSGTSMATPVVSGAIALMLQNQPSLTPDQVKARIMKTANKNLQPSTVATDPTTGISYDAQADVFTVGAGYLDIHAALTNTDAFPSTLGAAKSPAANISVNSSGVATVMLTPSTSLGGTSVLWGTSVVWGSSAVDANSVLWGSSVVWGKSTDSACSVIWGKSVIWGASVQAPDGQSFNGGDQ